MADEEFKDHSGDPFFPKVQWPPPELCPLCRAPSVTAGATAGKASSEAEPEWNEDEVCTLPQVSKLCHAEAAMQARAVQARASWV